MKLAISENREPNSPQSCENSGQMIHSEYDSHFSDGLFGTEQLLRTGFWRRLQKNDTVEVASERKVFFGADKTRAKWLKFRLFQLLLKRVHPKLLFARLFELTGFLVMEMGLR